MNKPEKITGVLVDAKTRTAKEITVDNTGDSFREVLQCANIARGTCRYRGGFPSTVLYNAAQGAENRIAARNSSGKPILYGNLFLCESDEHGALKSLSPVKLATFLAACNSHRPSAINNT